MVALRVLGFGQPLKIDPKRVQSGSLGPAKTHPGTWAGHGGKRLKRTESTFSTQLFMHMPLRQELVLLCVVLLRVDAGQEMSLTKPGRN